MFKRNKIINAIGLLKRYKQYIKKKGKNKYMKPLLEIVKLNKERYGLDFEPKAAIAKLQEELEEFIEGINTKNEHEQVDALLDIIVIAAGEITKLGYNPELALKQTVKEISSRKQNPDQAERWGKNNKNPGEKWKKDKSQDPSTLYKANYKTCKIKL